MVFWCFGFQTHHDFRSFRQESKRPTKSLAFSAWKAPRCPPASMPCATMASAPAASASSASPTVVATANHLATSTGLHSCAHPKFHVSPFPLAFSLCLIVWHLHNCWSCFTTLPRLPLPDLLFLHFLHHVGRINSHDGRDHGRSGFDHRGHLASVTAFKSAPKAVIPSVGLTRLDKE